MKGVTSSTLFTIVAVLYGSVAFAQIDTNAHEILWKPIKDTDILWRKRVWREIPVYEKQNVPLRDDPESPQENVFANVLLSGINAGVYKAYATAFGQDELQPDKANLELQPEKTSKWVDSDTSLPGVCLMHPLTKEDVGRMIACNPAGLSINSRRYMNFYAQHKNDSMEFLVEEAGAKKRKQERILEKAMLLYDTTAVASCAYPQQVDHYGIIEDWIFDRGEGQMVVRIVAIAPMMQGKPLFWLSYPDVRRYMARYDVYKRKTNTGYNWDEYFESRQFSSKITKVGKGPSSFTY